MTKDDIMKMAKEAGFADTFDDVHAFYQLEHFANLVAAVEQKRCIGIIYGQCGSDNVAQRTVDAIRSQA